jgi:hypothetical protein
VTWYDGITYVIPCGGSKIAHAAPARDLYTGQMFRHALTNVERLAALDEADGRAARILILSALHGLVELDTVLEPYDQRMDKAGAVSVEVLAVQAETFGIGWDDATERGSQVYAFLPRPYLARLDAALRTLYVYVQDVYEATAGIGEQRRVLSIVGRPAELAELPAGPGPTVWIGGDVNAFAWGVPLLVSYGRLRDARTLPVALAPWVLDSRGFVELAEHGRWTIDQARYVADCRRYRDEIGQLQWVAPQDWPAGAQMLARTGLSEAEHQDRTVASVVELRTTAPDLNVITVVTGRDTAGYLRCIEAYRAAGIDLRAETLPVGVGALVGRRAGEAADIIRMLYAAGLRNLHGFGVKSRVLDLVGGLVASVDSAGWSIDARHRAGMCPHGLTAWERNCPRAATTWGAGQRARAAGAFVQEALPLFTMPG